MAVRRSLPTKQAVDCHSHAHAPDVVTIKGGTCQRARSMPQYSLVFGSPWQRPTMMQSFASLARFLGGGSQSSPRRLMPWISPGYRHLGSSSTARYVKRRKDAMDSGVLDRLESRYTAGRRTKPCGISPVVTMRHRAMSSLRANATIMVLRILTPPSAVRARNHWTSALSFWNISIRQASCKPLCQPNKAAIS